MYLDIYQFSFSLKKKMAANGLPTPLSTSYHGSEIGTVEVLPGQLYHVNLPTGTSFYLRPHDPIAFLSSTEIVHGWKFIGTINNEEVYFNTHYNSDVESLIVVYRDYCGMSEEDAIASAAGDEVILYSP